MSLITNYVKSILPIDWISSPSGWTHGNCPMCVVNGESRPDIKGRGGFRFEDDKFSYNCFNCGYKTGWSPGKGISNRVKRLLLRFGADESDVQRLQLELLREEDVATILLKKEARSAPVVIDWEEMELPEGAQPINDYKGEVHLDFIKAVEYIHSRGFNIDDDRFMYSPASAPGRMKSRFIIPFHYKGKVVGYTARWIGKPPEGMPKYYNQQPKNNFIYVLDRQTKDKNIVIVTEGPLDAIVTDGIAIGSNNINDDQANIIDNLQKRVILLADKDFAGIKAVNTAIERGWSVSFPEWTDCKDAGDALERYGRLFTVRSILDGAISNPTKIKLLAQKYCK